MPRPIEIAPSILPVDFAHLGKALTDLEAAGCDRIHLDIMDGQFVPNLTFGPDVIASMRPHTKLPFEAHLMVLDADAMAKNYVDAGCQRLILHSEACPHLHRSLDHVRSLGATAGVAINPHTPAAEVENILDLVDLILVMTVNPGFGGQKYIASMEPKIAQVRAMINQRGLSESIDLEVDGGISATTVAAATRAGANTFVAGSALFRHEGGLKAAVSEIRANATAARAA